MIESLTEIEFSNKELQDAYLGEAYFLRAFTHFFLFINYRNIPLIKELPKAPNEYKPQATPEEAWDFIIDDLIKAKDLLPDKNFWDAKNKGRVTKASAYALLGKSYLYRSGIEPVSYTHLRAHETGRNLVCRLLLEKKKKKNCI